MLNQFSRTELLSGNAAMNKLRHSRVAIFGIGGVGGYAAEALVRSGVGTLDLIDDDRVCLTNLNRQIFATRKTVGKYKVDAAEERLHEICPQTDTPFNKRVKVPLFNLSSTALISLLILYGNMICYDAIDTVTGKLEIIMRAKEAGTPVISCMGAGNKVDPTALRVSDIYKTSVCPLARVMRKELRKRGVKNLKVVYSEEAPIKPFEDMSISCRNHCICPPDAQRKCTDRRDIPGSNAFVPSAAGLIIAGEVVKDLISFDPENRTT